MYHRLLALLRREKKLACFAESGVQTASKELYCAEYNFCVISIPNQGLEPTIKEQK